MDLTLPLFGRTGLSDSSRLTNLMLVAFTAFRLKQRPAENVSEPVLTGRYVTVGGSDEIVTLVEIEYVREENGIGTCGHSWIDLSDGSYVGDSLDAILDGMAGW